jgi:hypothetical protein
MIYEPPRPMGRIGSELGLLAIETMLQRDTSGEYAADLSS